MIEPGAIAFGLRTYSVSCDGSSAGEDFEAADWGGLMDALYDTKWKKSNKSGEYEHFCPACAEDM